MVDSSTMTVVSAANEDFVPHLATLFLSLLKTKQPETVIDFYVIDDNIMLPSKDALTRMVHEYNASITYLQIDRWEFEHMAESYRIPTTAYFRIAIPNYLKNVDAERVLYLDCDIVALESIEEIWNIDLGDKLLAAVEDAGFHGRLEAMNVETESNKYFNSGMMLIDIQKWREEKIPEQVLLFASEHDEILRFHDQDALNAILHDRWHALHPRWNAQNYVISKDVTHPTEEGEKEYEETREAPALVHFSGRVKPWHKQSDSPYQENYLELRNETPFAIEGELEEFEGELD